ncbi:MAG: VCBS repeat-containing protein, partial [Myxococcales bacterium]|nr:VCBS repeat-containing protein [Myxococcales bacterium]
MRAAVGTFWVLFLIIPRFESEANDAIRVAGEIIRQGGVNLGDGVAGVRAMAGLRPLSPEEARAADASPCDLVNLNGFDPSPAPPPCAPAPDGVFTADDVALIVTAAIGNVAIAPTLGYAQSLEGTLAGDFSETLFLGASRSPSVAFEDFDGDGTPELYSVGSERSIRAWRGPGATTPEDLEWSGYLSYVGGGFDEFLTALAFADFDGDGRRDIVGCGGRFLRFARNLGLDAEMRPIFDLPVDILDGVGVATTVAGALAHAAPADFTGDGAPDLFVGHLSGIDFFENNGDGVPGAPATLTPVGRVTPLPLDGGGEVGDVFATPAAADLNGDGLADLLVASADEIYFFRNVGAFDGDGFPEFAAGIDAVPAPLQSPITGLAIGRFDNDAVPDLIAASHFPPLFVYYRGIDATPTFAAGVVVEPGDAILALKGETYPMSGDLAGGSDDDLLVSLDGTNVELFEIVDSGDAPSLAAPASVRPMQGGGGGTARGRPVLLDLDGDEDLDLLLAEIAPSPRILSVENAPVGGLPNFTGHDFIQSGGSAIQFSGNFLYLAAGDLDGDGDKDVLGMIDDGGPRLWMLERRNAGVADPFLDAFAAPVEIPVHGRRELLSPVLVDLDFDGDLDILAKPANYTETMIQLNLGSPAAPVFSGVIEMPNPSLFYPTSGFGSLAVFDFGNDGDLDFLVGDGIGGLRLWRSVQAD